MATTGAKQLSVIVPDIACTVVSRFGLDFHCLLFDATNFFTFLDSFNLRAQLPQRGHSKEGRDNLRILGLALLVSADSEVPLFHHPYAGNQHDAVTFHGVVEELLQRCGSLAQQLRDITLVFDKGNNSEDNLKILQKRAAHFLGSLVPTQHPDLLAIPRENMRRLDRAYLPAVWAYRTHKVVFGVERTIVVTFNRKLFRAQTRTLEREIRKRQGKLEKLQGQLRRRRPGDRGKKPTVKGVENKVKEILRGRHMKDLFAAQVRKTGSGLRRLWL